MHKGFLRGGALLGALSVILGAFGAHALKQWMGEKELATFEIGVRYQFYHAFALLMVGMLFKEFINNYLRWAGRLFAIGILIFSGSLYLLTILEATGRHDFKWLGAITPIGGVCFIGGWIIMAIGISKKTTLQ